MPRPEKKGPIAFRHALRPGIQGAGDGCEPAADGIRGEGHRPRLPHLCVIGFGLNPSPVGTARANMKEGTSMGIIATIVVVAVVIALALWLLRRA